LSAFVTIVQFKKVVLRLRLRETVLALKLCALAAPDSHDSDKAIRHACLMTVKRGRRSMSKAYLWLLVHAKTTSVAEVKCGQDNTKMLEILRNKLIEVLLFFTVLTKPRGWKNVVAGVLMCRIIRCMTAEA
jgi:hypothetical protein